MSVESTYLSRRRTQAMLVVVVVLCVLVGKSTSFQVREYRVTWSSPGALSLLPSAGQVSSQRVSSGEVRQRTSSVCDDATEQDGERGRTESQVY